MHGRPHTMRRSWPRRITFAAVLLIAGLLISVGVAWGCTLWVPIRFGSNEIAGAQDANNAWRLSDRNGFAPTTAEQRVVLDGLLKDYLELRADRVREGSEGGPSSVDNSWVMSSGRFGQSYSGLLVSFRDELSGQKEFWLLQAGWPSRCVETYSLWGHLLPSQPNHAWRGVLVAPDWIAVHDSETRVPAALPYLPLWPGLLFNTIFYATILWLFTFGLGFIRRARRRAKGRCVFCGYSLTGLAKGATCPECGRCGAASVSDTSRTGA